LPARGGEKRRRRGQTAGEPAERGRKTGRRGSLTAAYRRWPGSWSEGGGLARAEVGDSNGRFNLTRGGLGGGCPRGGGGAPRRGSPPVGSGWGTGAGRGCFGFVATRGSCSAHSIPCRTNREGEGGGGKDSPERRTTPALCELCSGEGRRGVAEAGAWKEGLGASLL
jgi:hypothetical protein